MMRISWLLLLSAVAQAGSRGEYAVEFPLRGEAGAAAYSLELPVGVYRELVDPALGDLEAFNAAGEPVPMAMVAPPPLPTHEVTRFVAVEFFALPRPGAAPADETLHLSIERDATGRLRRLDAQTGPTASAPAQMLLLDAGERHDPIVALRLDWDAANAPWLRLKVEGSDDLQSWQTLDGEISLYQIDQAANRFERRRAELPGWQPRYLLLSATDPAAPLPEVRSIELGLRDAAQPVEAPWQWQTLEADAAADSGYEFSAPGPLPIQRVAVELGSQNSTAQVAVYSRANSRAGWQLRAQFTAFRLSDRGREASSEAVSIGLSRDRHWRIEATPALDRPPNLRVGYRPDRIVLLARGTAPYTLAVGSAQARRVDAPLASLVEQLRGQFGADWQPAVATLGEPQALAGAQAREPGWRPQQTKSLLLWGVLIAGVAVIAAMVWRLLREARAQ